MHRVQEKLFSSYSAAQLYALVNDVGAYPQFLPGCAATRIIEENASIMEAELTIEQMGVTKHFTTRNTLYLNERIEMNLVQGPFKDFKGLWIFEDYENGSFVSLDLFFSFEKNLVNLFFSKVFEQLSKQMVRSFLNRAVMVYE